MQISQRGSDDLEQTIQRYYHDTLSHYRLVWFRGQSRAMHFGYWDETTTNHLQSLENMNAQLALRIGIQPGERILDAGCGIGDSAVWLARHRPVEVVGITLVPDQVELACAFARQMGVSERVSFHAQDYSQTSFPDASFDVIWALESICHALDKRAFLREARRLLRPGGRIGIVEYMRSERPFTEADESLMRTWCDGWAMPNLATDSDYAKWATELGFADIHVTDITHHILPSIRRLYRTAVLVWPVAGLLRALRLSTQTQYANKLSVLTGYHALAQRLWYERMLTARLGSR